MMTPTKRMVLQGLREILERGSAQHHPQCGLCANFRIWQRDKFMVTWGYRTPQLEALVNTSYTVFFHAIRAYADEHGLDRDYPIEGGAFGYDKNNHKWEGLWLERRQTMIKWLINYIEVPDETSETHASKGAE